MNKNIKQRVLATSVAVMAASLALSGCTNDPKPAEAVVATATAPAPTASSSATAPANGDAKGVDDKAAAEKKVAAVAAEAKKVQDDAEAKKAEVEAAVVAVIPEASGVYTIQSGDTLSGIAESLGWGTAYDIAAWNGIADVNSIFAGDVICQPGVGTQAVQPVVNYVAPAATQPVVQAPVVAAPAAPEVTNPPAVAPPVTVPPTTQPPVTQPPVTTPPTKPPVTEPPVVEPPVTTPPTTEPPVTEPPVTEPPVTEPPRPIWNTNDSVGAYVNGLRLGAGQDSLPTGSCYSWAKAHVSASVTGSVADVKEWTDPAHFAVVTGAGFKTMEITITDAGISDYIDVNFC